MKFIFFCILVIAGFCTWHYFANPDPVKKRAKVQKSNWRTVDYYFYAARDDRLQDMEAVSSGGLKGNNQNVLDEIHDVEKAMGVELADHNSMGMGGGGGVKVMLMDENSGLMMSLTVIVKEIDGKKWIVDATPD